MEEWPPGFRFFPTEEELVSFYLCNKLDGRREDLNRLIDPIIPVLDVYQFNPWELPQFSGGVSNNEAEQWFFFIPRQESEARGGRPKRLTADGYWKATGSPGHVYSNNHIIGMKRTMVFYKGRAPSGHRTEWKMNEYKAIQEEASGSAGEGTHPVLRQEFSLCRVYKRSNSLRAFDRRPRGLGVELDQTTAQQVLFGAATMSHRENAPPEASSSGDHGNNPSQIEEIISGNMPISTENNDPFWDWVQFNWD